MFWHMKIIAKLYWCTVWLQFLYAKLYRYNLAMISICQNILRVWWNMFTVTPGQLCKWWTFSVQFVSFWTELKDGNCIFHDNGIFFRTITAQDIQLRQKFVRWVKIRLNTRLDLRYLFPPCSANSVEQN